ncbi:hypothetical protein FOCC_FOCC004578 [Frankliniella occidentalis]|nr:hypothetical protein FOCC_FOCC004578 [Frankliniella occidentalis]
MGRSKGPGRSTQPKQKWRKILYGNREYPDNYTDSSFLQEMRKNVHIYHELPWDTCGIDVKQFLRMGIGIIS